MDARGQNPVEAVLGRWPDGPGPLHRKLTEAFRHAIEYGHLASGERLPSERDLAARLAVSRSTVVAAYDVLRAEGLLESRQGSGTRVCKLRPHANADGISPNGIRVSPVYRALLSPSDEVISLACAVLPAHPLVADTIATVVREEGDKLLAIGGYYPAGLPALRHAIAEMLSTEGVPTSPEHVVVTNGAQQAVHLAGSLFLHPGDDVVVESPCFHGMLDVFRTRGARLVTAPVDQDGVDVEMVADLVTARRPSAVYVTPSFHNPTGARLNETRRRAIADLINRARVPLIEDNALEHFPLDDLRVPPIAAFADPEAPIVTVGSLSKPAWAGLRVGWVRGPVPLITRLGELKAMSDLGSPYLEQAVAVRLIPHLVQMRADHQVVLRRNLDVLCDLLADVLPSWEWERPRGGPSLWVKLPSGDAAAFAQVALRFGVEVVPGDMMSPSTDHPQHLRIPFTAEPPVLDETVKRLAAAWQAYAPSDTGRRHPRTVVV